MFNSIAAVVSVIMAASPKPIALGIVAAVVSVIIYLT